MAKGVALIFIIVSHSLFAYDLPLECVPVFYFCAGFTSRPDFSLARRARAILLPYLIISVLCVAFTWRYYSGYLTPEAWIGVLYSRISIDVIRPGVGYVSYMPLFNAVTWFLTSFFTSYCVYKLILAARGRRAQIAACCVSLLIAWALSYLPILLPWSLDTAFFFAPIMWLGGQARRLDFFSRVSLGRFAGVAILFLTSYAVTGHINLSIRDYGAGIFAAFIYSLASVALLICICKALESVGITLPLTRMLNGKALYLYGLQLMTLNRGDNYAMRIRRKFSQMREILAPDSVGVMIFQVVFAIAAGFALACVIDFLIGLLRKRVAPSLRVGQSRPTRR